MSLIDDLARLREVQGKEPLPNPHIIAGFGPDDPPTPALGPVDRRGEEFPPMIEDEFRDADAPEPPPPSPLIPRRAPTALVSNPGVPLTPPQMAGMPPLPDLVVLGHVGAWKGREVVLSDAEERAVRAVVLRAIAREVHADLEAAGVRRVRKAKVELQAAPKKRGRPRKVKP